MLYYLYFVCTERIQSMKHTLKRIVFLLLAATLVITALPVVVSAEDDEIVYHVRPVVDGGRTISADNYHTAESEHFQLLWGDQNNSYITEAWIQNVFNIYEACWSLYVDDLGMTPPSLCTRRGSDQTTHYKVNIIVWGTGIPGYHNAADPNEWAAYGGIDQQGYGYMMCCRAAMESNSWALPHEFGHVTQFAQGYNSWADGMYLGPWYEAIGNWYREQYLYSDYYTAGGSRTDFSHLILRAASLTATNGRSYYESWPLLQYLTENPDGLEGYGPDFVAKLLQNGSASGYMYNMIDEQADASLEDTLGYFAAHMAALDFVHGKEYKKNIANNAESWQEFFWQQFYTTLEAKTGAENTYVVPTERAPQQAAFVAAPLTVTGDEVSVTLHGLSARKGAAWRACIVTVSGGKASYSALFGDGETMKANVAGADEVYLTVAATPDLKTYVKSSVFQSEQEVSFDSKPRYPFEAVITGAVPYEREISTSRTKGDAHPNGGGFVASTAKVADSVYVAPDAMVLGQARVSGDARIEDHAVVMGSAKISGNVVVDGYAVVAGSPTLRDNVHVGDYAVVTGSATLKGNAQVIESAFVSGSYNLKGNAIAKGLAICIGGGTLDENGVVDGEFYDDSGLSIKSGTVKGYIPAFNGNDAKSYIRRLKSTDNLLLGYEFSKTDDAMMSPDLYSSTYATVYGAEWNEGSYTFSDASQYILVDAEALNSRGDLQIKLRARYDGGDGQLMHFDGKNGSLTLTPKNGDGKAELTLKVGEETVTLTSKSALPTGEWVDIVVTFADGKAVLTIGSETHAAVETSLMPYGISADNGIIGGVTGAVDSLSFYSANVSGVSMTVTAADAPNNSGNSDDTTAPAETTGNGSSTEEQSGCGSAMGGVSITAALAVALLALKKRK